MGRAGRPSLFFVVCAGGLLLAASLRPADTYLAWIGVGLLIVAFGTSRRHLPANLLSAGVALFCAWLFASAVFFTPQYSAYGVYRPLVIFGGFAAAALLGDAERKALLHTGAALLALLVLIGLLQVFFGIWSYEADLKRAAAAFATPNTFATAINLVLLPLLALVVVGRGGRKAYLALLWLFAGLLSTESRGGWISFAAGLVFVAAYAGLPKSRDVWARWWYIAAGLLGVLIAYYLIKAAVVTKVLSLGGGTIAGLFAEDLVERGSSFRLDLANVALKLIAERPLAGAGSNTFWPLYEMTKPQELDIGVTFPFVHNDYLQTWVEFGLPGIILLCAIPAVALTMILRARSADEDDPVPLACGAALAGIFMHAAGDFPLYVPFPAMVLGVWLGVLATHAGNATWATAARARVGHRMRPVLTPIVLGMLMMAALVWLGQPAMGELAARRALGQLADGNAENGLYWQSVARRLEPRSGRRYWEEGVIWRNLALAAGDRSLAAKADALFAEGTRVAPYDLNNFAERARLHRVHAQLLEQPASPEEILKWTARARELRPYMIAAWAEYARALAYAGRIEEARAQARDMVAQHPNSRIARRLAAEM